MRAIIAGSRNIKDLKVVEEAIRESRFVIDEVVSGGASGVDRLGEQWATRYSKPIIRFLANWNKFGRGAGFVRNAEMARYGDVLIAIWDGKSPGTKNMIKVMQKYGKPVHVKDLSEVLSHKG